VFFVNLPFGIITVLGLVIFMDETRQDHQPALRLVRLRGARDRHRQPAGRARSRRAARLARINEIIAEFIIAAVGFYYSSRIRSRRRGRSSSSRCSRTRTSSAAACS